MHSLAIIGAGQLGSRHLQGLARLELPCEIAVVDPSEASLRVARARFDELPANPAIRNVSYHLSIDDLPTVLDYVVVATTADVRLAVLQALLQRSRVQYMLLEKVLFQRLADHATAGALLSSQGVRAWVSCGRRLFPIYHRLRDFFAIDPLLYFQVMGGGWGLGCNSIHFLDLLGMLSGAVPSEVSTAGLDAGLIPSKRPRFFEFTGSLSGRFDRTRFDISSLAGSSARLVLTLRAESRSCVVDESAGMAFLFDGAQGAGWQQAEFSIPLTSNLSTTIAAQILGTGTCELSTFEQSCVYHLPLLAALAEHARASSGTPAGFCPIT